MNNKDKIEVIDRKFGNIFDENSNDEVILFGEVSNYGGSYVDNLSLVINFENSSIKNATKKLPYGGYSLKLFIADFNGDGKSEIMVRGDYGGTGGFEIDYIYDFYNNELVEIFNSEMFNDKYKFEGKFLNNKLVEVISLTDKRVYYIDISNKSKEYFDIVYDENGNVNKYSFITISSLNAAYPINQVFNEEYSLLIQQRIIGITNADTLGILQSLIELKGNRINNIYTNLLTFGEEYSEKEVSKINDKYELPLGAIKVNAEGIGNRDGILVEDIDLDGELEYIRAYSLNEKVYLAVYKSINGINKIVSVYEGKGKGIDNIKIISINRKKLVIIAWEIQERVNKIEILEYGKENFNNIKNIKLPYTYKFYIEETGSGDEKELVLWSYKEEKSYQISIFKITQYGVYEKNKYIYNA